MMKGTKADTVGMPLSQREGAVKGKKLTTGRKSRKADFPDKNAPSSSFADPTQEIMAYFNSSVRSDEEKAVYRAMLNEISTCTKKSTTRISSAAEIESNVEKTLSTIPLSSLQKPLGSKTFMDPKVNRLSLQLNRKLERGNVAKGGLDFRRLRSRSSLNSRGDFKDSNTFLNSISSNDILSLGHESEQLLVDYGSDFDIHPLGNQIRPKTRRFDAGKNLLLADGKRVLKKTQRVASVTVNKQNSMNSLEKQKKVTTPRISRPPLHTPKTPKTNQIPLTPKKISISKIAAGIVRPLNETKSENLIHVQPVSSSSTKANMSKRTPRNYNQNARSIRSINIRAPFFNNNSEAHNISPSLSSTSCSKTEGNTNKIQHKSKDISSILKDKKGTTSKSTNSSGRKLGQTVKPNEETLVKIKKEVPIQTLAKLLGNSDMVSLKSFSEMLSQKERKTNTARSSTVLSPKKSTIKNTKLLSNHNNNNNTQESDSTDNFSSNADQIKIPENKNVKHVQNNTNCEEDNNNNSCRIPAVIKKKVMTKRKSKSIISIDIQLNNCLARQEKLENDVQEFISKIEKDTASKSCTTETLQALTFLVKTQKQIINMQIDLKKQQFNSANNATSKVLSEIENVEST